MFVSVAVYVNATLDCSVKYKNAVRLLTLRLFNLGALNFNA